MTGKFEWVHSSGGAKYKLDRLKSAIFDQYLAISQNRCKIGTWLLWKANRNSYALYRIALFQVIFSDSYRYPKPTQFLLFVSLFSVRYMLSPVRLSVVCLSVVCLSVCNARAPYSSGLNFPQYFYGIWYLGHPVTSHKILRRSSQGNPSARGVKDKRGRQI